MVSIKCNTSAATGDINDDAGSDVVGGIDDCVFWASVTNKGMTFIAGNALIRNRCSASTTPAMWSPVSNDGFGVPAGDRKVLVSAVVLPMNGLLPVLDSGGIGLSLPTGLSGPSAGVVPPLLADTRGEGGTLLECVEDTLGLDSDSVEMPTSGSGQGGVNNWTFGTIGARSFQLVDTTGGDGGTHGSSSGENGHNIHDGQPLHNDLNTDNASSRTHCPGSLDSLFTSAHTTGIR